jgi:hypothetical protein
MSYVCEDCGREFAKEAYRDVHPCSAVIGTVKARAIRSQFDPGQFSLEEYADGERPAEIDRTERR